MRGLCGGSQPTRGPLIAILILAGGWYAGAVAYYLIVGWLYPKGNGAAIMMEAGIWPYWTVRRIWWALFGPPRAT